jgi:hypothetical protein
MPFWLLWWSSNLHAITVVSPDAELLDLPWLAEAAKDDVEPPKNLRLLDVFHVCIVYGLYIVQAV